MTASVSKLSLDIQTTYISNTEKYLSVRIKVSLNDVASQICIKYFKSCKTNICSKHTQYVGSINETKKWNAETWIYHICYILLPTYLIYPNNPTAAGETQTDLSWGISSCSASWPPPSWTCLEHLWNISRFLKGCSAILWSIIHIFIYI